MPPLFLDRLLAAQQVSGSCLCVGLDPDPRDLPDTLRDLPTGRAVATFCADLVRATAPFASAYKPNAAFFEALGADGPGVLAHVVGTIRQFAPHALVVLDGKRGDIGHTAAMYARAAFDQTGAEAATVSPYMGREAVTPFLDHVGRCAFVLARTSNPGAAEVQTARVDATGAFPAEPLFHRVVRQAQAWADSAHGTLGFVAGATDAASLADIRRLAPGAPLLVPGVGAQGGDIAAVLKANAGGPILVNVSRAIATANDAANAARSFAAQLRI